jgi:hypothetical protein
LILFSFGSIIYYYYLNAEIQFLCKIFIFRPFCRPLQSAAGAAATLAPPPLRQARYFFTQIKGID